MRSRARGGLASNTRCAFTKYWGNRFLPYRGSIARRRSRSGKQQGRRLMATLRWTAREACVRNRNRGVVVNRDSHVLEPGLEHGLVPLAGGFSGRVGTVVTHSLGFTPGPPIGHAYRRISQLVRSKKPLRRWVLRLSRHVKPPERWAIPFNRCTVPLGRCTVRSDATQYRSTAAPYAQPLRSTLSRCMVPLSRCMVPLSRCMVPLNRCIVPFSRCAVRSTATQYRSTAARYGQPTRSPCIPLLRTEYREMIPASRCAVPESAARYRKTAAQCRKPTSSTRGPSRSSRRTPVGSCDLPHPHQFREFVPCGGNLLWQVDDVTETFGGANDGGDVRKSRLRPPRGDCAGSTSAKPCPSS